MSNSYYLTSQMPTVNMVNGFRLSSNDPVNLRVHSFQVIGQGTFGSIEKANVSVLKSEKEGDVNGSEKAGSHEKFVGAIKKVHQDPRYKNRELNIIQKIRCHPNIVDFKYYYYSIVGGDENARGTGQSNGNSSGQQPGASSSQHHPGGAAQTGPSGSVYLHLVMECLPECLSDLIVRYHRHGAALPARHVRLYTFQMLRALAHLHSLAVCHRDIKTSNLLVDEQRQILKLCDFGSAKQLQSGSPSVSYISSRYYRAPELLFGAQLYTTAIDVWSGGCVLGEMLRMACLFTGSDTVDQIVKIIRVLGTPSSVDLEAMNPGSSSGGGGPAGLNLPHVMPCPVRLFFPHHCPADLLDLLSRMLVYSPAKRPHPSRLLLHPAFAELLPAVGAAGSSGGGSSGSSSLPCFQVDELSPLSTPEKHQLLHPASNATGSGSSGP